MRNQPYYPKDEGKQVLWLDNLLQKIGSYTIPLEISVAELAAVQNDLTNLLWVWQTWLPAWRPYSKAGTEYRTYLATGTGTAPIAPPMAPILTPPATAVAPGALTRTFVRISAWKKRPGYTTSIGDDLRLIGPAGLPHTDPPVLKQRASGTGWVELTFKVWEHAGIWIESRRQGEESWSFLAIDTARPFRDARPTLPSQPTEWREYRACWWDNATPSRAFGPVLRVTVGS